MRRFTCFQAKNVVFFESFRCFHPFFHVLQGSEGRNGFRSKQLGQRELEGPLPQAGSLSPESLAELVAQEEVAGMKPEAALRRASRGSRDLGSIFDMFS